MLILVLTGPTEPVIASPQPNKTKLSLKTNLVWMRFLSMILANWMNHQMDDILDYNFFHNYEPFSIPAIPDLTLNKKDGHFLSFFFWERIAMEGNRRVRVVHILV